MVKIGDKIRIISMLGESQYIGKEGVVTSIDSIGQIHGTWGGCAIIPDKDEFVILSNDVIPVQWIKDYLSEMNDSQTIQAISELLHDWDLWKKEGTD